MKHSNIARVSEDFYPLIEASHWAHIANSAFITLMVVSEHVALLYSSGTACLPPVA